MDFRFAVRLACVLIATALPAGAALTAPGEFRGYAQVVLISHAGTPTFLAENRVSESPLTAFGFTSTAIDGSGTATSTADRGYLNYDGDVKALRPMNPTLPGRYYSGIVDLAGSASATYRDFVVSFADGSAGTPGQTVPLTMNLLVSGSMSAEGEHIISNAHQSVFASAFVHNQSGSTVFDFLGTDGDSSQLSITGMVPIDQPFSVGLGLGLQSLANFIGRGGSFSEPPGPVVLSLDATVTLDESFGGASLLSAASGGSGASGAFILPDGFVVNSAQMNVVNNRWLGPTLTIPEPSIPLGLLVILPFLRRRPPKKRRQDRSSLQVS